MLPRRPGLPEGWSGPSPGNVSHYVREGAPACGAPGFYVGPVHPEPPPDSRACPDCMFFLAVPY